MGGACVEERSTGSEGVVARIAPADDVSSGPVFSEKLVKIGGGSAYEFHDTAAAFIGLGSFGVVFRGRCQRSKKDVAIKRIERAQVKPDELRVIKAIHSAFLVGVLDFFEGVGEEDPCYLVMELCDTDLDHHIKCTAKEHKLNPGNLRLVVDNLARGYAALHELNIVHRDIKPQNVLITYSHENGHNDRLESAKITDFGIARVLNDQQLSNVAGTLHYMAPEVGANLLRECQYDSKVDMWSIGCLIYQCVTGEMPFDECALCRLFLNTAGGNFDAYDRPELPGGVATEIQEIIYALLEIDSDKRCTPERFYKMATQLIPVAAKAH